MAEPIIAGWMNYYGRYYRSAVTPLLQRGNIYLRRWAGKKYKRLRAARWPVPGTKRNLDDDREQDRLGEIMLERGRAAGDVEHHLPYAQISTDRTRSNDDAASLHGHELSYRV